jgi:Ser/Thr protein kinase RdoA (MazF antagonist)
VHADLRLANLLVDGPQLNVIDFDDCGLSWFVYDFAAAITFIEHEPIVPALLDAWVAGYRQITSLSDQDAAEIPVMVMLRRILILAWIASHAETPTAQQMGVNYTNQTLEMAETFLGRYS